MYLPISRPLSWATSAIVLARDLENIGYQLYLNNLPITSCTIKVCNGYPVYSGQQSHRGWYWRTLGRDKTSDILVAPQQPPYLQFAMPFILAYMAGYQYKRTLYLGQIKCGQEVPARKYINLPVYSQSSS